MSLDNKTKILIDKIISSKTTTAVLFLLIGLVAGYFISAYLFSKGDIISTQQTNRGVAISGGPIRSGIKKYQFVQPLLGFEVSDTKFNEYEPMVAKINNIISKAKTNGDASDVSIYFRNFKNGHWTGIDENKKYFPASLFKVPIMISYFQRAEKDPGILYRKIYYNEPPQIEEDNAFSTLGLLQPGYEYTIAELIRDMIINSDNSAMNTLLDYEDKNTLPELFKSLEIQFPDNTTKDEINYGISARSYALFFRVLYGSTILNSDDSEEALRLLNQTTFKDGLNSGLPANIPVAHKFGEHIKQPIGTELHDCGIVYSSKGPYLLCVMTRGSDVNKLKSIISEISKVVYQFVD